MQIFPAIDLINGQSVRLYQGDYDQKKRQSPPTPSPKRKALNKLA